MGDVNEIDVYNFGGELMVHLSDFEALEARIAELEGRLEIDPSHHVDGIAARDATIELQDAAIDDLKRKFAELEKDAARWRYVADQHSVAWADEIDDAMSREA